MRSLVLSLGLLVAGLGGPARAADELATAGDVSYILTTNESRSVRYAVILMPGGSGNLNPRLQDGKLVFAFGGNFLIRSRMLFADGQFVAASTDATSTPTRILAIAQDLQKRYGPIQVYVAGTSRSTEATLSLAKTIDGQVAGFVHSSSVNGISSFDPRGLKSRHLIVVHRMDGCRVTRPSAGQASHNSYGTELVEMEGGKSVGDDCEAYSHHGYNGIERETVARIKEWIANAR
jgi:hypothetical protein